MPKKLKDLLGKYLPAEEIRQVTGSYDVAGDIAIVIIPPSLEDRERLIGQLLLASQPRLRVVVKRSGLYGGEFRTIGLRVIAGEQRTQTEVREFGLSYRLDLAEVYFSIRSGSERRRIAVQVSQGERVLVLFSGIAPYPLVISRFSLACHITGIEKNPIAHQFALANVRLNKKQELISLLCGDVADILPRLGEKFDRVVMPLPTLGAQFLPLALQSLKNPGKLHYYAMQGLAEEENAILALVKSCEGQGRSIGQFEVFRCGHCAPKVYRICVDAVIL